MIKISNLRCIISMTGYKSAIPAGAVAQNGLVFWDAEVMCDSFLSFISPRIFLNNQKSALNIKGWEAVHWVSWSIIFIGTWTAHTHANTALLRFYQCHSWSYKMKKKNEFVILEEITSVISSRSIKLIWNYSNKLIWLYRRNYFTEKVCHERK